MTDYTPEQRAAVKWLRALAEHGTEFTTSHSEALLSLVPEELTAQPTLPEGPGWFLGDGGTTAVWIDKGGVFWGQVHTTVTDPERLAPFVPLVRPLTKAQMERALYAAKDLGVATPSWEEQLYKNLVKEQTA